MENNRRDFLKKAGLLTLGSGLLSNINLRAEDPSKSKPITTAIAEPSAIQKAWMDMKFGMFIHFGINTYYDMEWSDGTLDPIKYNPTELDTDQWCHVAKEAGMKYIVLVAKHHDGFCNWPTKYTNYSVSASPFKGDVVGSLANSANKYGIKLGLYYSLWDRHEKSHDENEYKYIEFMKNQLTELLTQYGDVVELWFDGFWKKQQSGWAKQITDETGENVVGTEESKDRNEKFIKAWRMEGSYRWQFDHVYQYIKTLQPNCLVMNNATTAYCGVPLHPVDIRSGEKYTKVKSDQKIWNWLGKDIFLPLQIETTMSQKGNTNFKSGSWFWHDWDHSVAPKEKILQWLAVSEQMQANLLLNCGVMANGKLRPEDEKMLLSLRK